MNVNEIENYHQIWLQAYQSGMNIVHDGNTSLIKIEQLALNHANTVLKEYKKVVLNKK